MSVESTVVLDASPASLTPRRRRKLLAPSRAATAARTVALTVICILFGYPLLWLVFGSLKTQQTFFTNLWGLPAWDFANYADAWVTGNMGQYLINSVIVSVSSVALTLLLSLPISFAIARHAFPGSQIVFGFFLVTLFVPLQLIIVPLYELEASLGLINTYLGLILPYASGGLPFAVVFATSFFRSLPADIDEAAVLDGCNSGQVFLRIALPLAKPAVATVVIFSFLGVWNEFILALTLTQSDSVRTIPVGLLNFTQSFGQTAYPSLFAALTIATVPVVTIFIVFQRAFISGLVDGAVR